MIIKNENGKTDNMSYLVIKDEPVEWTETEMEIMEEKEVFPEESVKMEGYESTSNEGTLLVKIILPADMNYRYRSNY